VSFPNPEEKPAMKMALEPGKKINADLVVGTDPDADRVGIGVPDLGDFVLITGNQLGALFADYMFGGLIEKNKMPLKPLLIKTIVTTELQRKIAQKYDALCEDVLTGFKYIGEKIREYEIIPNSPHFVVGGEESYGYLVHTKARDKDAVSATTMAVEMTLYHVTQGKSVMDRLRELWFEFGYYEETLISKYFKGESGLTIMNGMMEDLRKNPTAEFAGERVNEIKDYKNGTTLNPKTKKSEKNIHLPSSNVLQFILADETIVTVRPSGTEPKIKFYASCHSEPKIELAKAKKRVDDKIKKIEEEVGRLIEKAVK
jgi:phosphoglucomutase